MKTERLRIDPLAARHAQAFLAFFERNRAHLEPWEPKRDDSFYTLAFHIGDIAKSEIAAGRGNEARFVAFEHDRDEIVASVNLRNIRRGVIHAATIGYAVDGSREGLGYATEAVGAVLRFAMETLNLHRIETSYQPGNVRSGRVLEKLGFAVEGRAQKYLLIDGAWRDGILVALINDDWRPNDPS